MGIAGPPEEPIHAQIAATLGRLPALGILSLGACYLQVGAMRGGAGGWARFLTAISGGHLCRSARLCLLRHANEPYRSCPPAGVPGRVAGHDQPACSLPGRQRHGQPAGGGRGCRCAFRSSLASLAAWSPRLLFAPQIELELNFYTPCRAPTWSGCWCWASTGACCSPRTARCWPRRACASSAS